MAGRPPSCARFRLQSVPPSGAEPTSHPAAGARFRLQSAPPSGKLFKHNLTTLGFNVEKVQHKNVVFTVGCRRKKKSQILMEECTSKIPMH